MSFNKLPIRFDCEPLKAWLEDCDLWGERPERCREGSPHEQTTDIWVRFKDPQEHLDSGDWSTFIDPHESKWLQEVPGVRDMCKDLMVLTGGTRLGGVLITKLAPGDEILPHSDAGWHAEYYDKYFVSIKNSAGARFCFKDGYIEPEEGEVHGFRNDRPHWVQNTSKFDRIAMIVCIKQDRFNMEGVLCHG